MLGTLALSSLGASRASEESRGPPTRLFGLPAPASRELARLESLLPAKPTKYFQLHPLLHLNNSLAMLH